MISPPQRQVKWSELGVKKSGKYDDLRVQFSCLVMFKSFRPHEPQHARPPCPSPIAGIYSNPCPLSRWCHPTVSSSVVPFSSCLQSFPASESFQMSQLFTSGGQSIGALALATVLPKNIQGWFPLGWTFAKPLRSGDVFWGNQGIIRGLEPSVSPPLTSQQERGAEGWVNHSWPMS